MRKFLSVKSEIFGLDINDFSVKILKLKEKRGQLYLVSLAEAEIDNGLVEEGVIKNENALADIIKRACKNMQGESLNTKYVVASLPEEKSFLQVIKMPNLEEKELKSAALFEVENYIPLSVSDIYVDFQKISSDPENNTSEVLIVAMAKPIIDSYISCLEKAGLIPVSLVVESQAISRAVMGDISGDSVFAIVDFGRNNSNLIVYSRNSVRFACSVGVGSSQISQAIADSLKINLNEAENLKINNGLTGDPKVSGAVSPILDEFATQIKKYADFYTEHFFHENPSPEEKIEKIFMCGGGSELKGLPEYFSKKLGIQVELASIFKNIFYNNKKILMQNPLSFTTSLGLARRGIIENKKYPHI